MIRVPITSFSINEAVAKAIRAGNEVKETNSWPKMRFVLTMRDPRTETLRSDLQSDKRLRYSVWNYDTHYPAEESFIDDVEKICVPSRMITFSLGDLRCSWQDLF